MVLSSSVVPVLKKPKVDSEGKIKGNIFKLPGTNPKLAKYNKLGAVENKLQYAIESPTANIIELNPCRQGNEGVEMSDTLCSKYGIKLTFTD